jgi:hypothetical protein
MKGNDFLLLKIISVAKFFIQDIWFKIYINQLNEYITLE